MSETADDIRERAIGYWVDATASVKPGDIISTIDLIAKAFMSADAAMKFRSKVIDKAMKVAA